ncbi:MAG: hypothetical protein Q4D37_02785 [Oscillospiraceae bacterium]|nr:hypothetical protein [Oscillospiraceae bacterium]
MMKKILTVAAVGTMLLTAVGCSSDKDSSSETAESKVVSTTLQTTAEETASEPAETTTIDIEAIMPEELKLAPDFVLFEKIRFQVPEDWGNMNVENLSVWYPMDGSGALTLQIFDPASMGMEGDSQKETLENLGKHLAEEQTIVSEVWNTVQDADAYAITYSPAAEEEVDVAQKMNLSILFYVEDTPYSMTFSNYTGVSPVLKNATNIMDTVQF